MGYASEADTDDFNKVSEVFEKAVADLCKAGAEIIDPIAIPDLKALMATRTRSIVDDDAMFELYFKGGKAPFATRAAAMASPLFQQVTNSGRVRWSTPSSSEGQLAYQRARDTLGLQMLGNELARAGTEMNRRRTTESLDRHATPVANRRESHRSR